LFACFQEPEGPYSLRPSGLKARLSDLFTPKNTHKSAKKDLQNAVFAAFLAKIMHDSLHLDA
jgi:hypothetical protein